MKATPEEILEMIKTTMPMNIFVKVSLLSMLWSRGKKVYDVSDFLGNHLDDAVARAARSSHPILAALNDIDFVSNKIFDTWRTENQIEKMSGKRWAAFMQKLGCTAGKRNCGERGWLGIKERTETTNGTYFGH